MYYNVFHCLVDSQAEEETENEEEPDEEGPEKRSEKAQDSDDDNEVSTPRRQSDESDPNNSDQEIITREKSTKENDQDIEDGDEFVTMVQASTLEAPRPSLPEPKNIDNVERICTVEVPSLDQTLENLSHEDDNYYSFNEGPKVNGPKLDKPKTEDAHAEYSAVLSDSHDTAVEQPSAIEHERKEEPDEKESRAETPVEDNVLKVNDAKFDDELMSEVGSMKEKPFLRTYHCRYHIVT